MYVNHMDFALWLLQQVAAAALPLDQEKNNRGSVCSVMVKKLITSSSSSASLSRPVVELQAQPSTSSQLSRVNNSVARSACP